MGSLLSAVREYMRLPERDVDLVRAALALPRERFYGFWAAHSGGKNPKAAARKARERLVYFAEQRQTRSKQERKPGKETLARLRDMLLAERTPVKIRARGTIGGDSEVDSRYRDIRGYAGLPTLRAMLAIAEAAEKERWPADVIEQHICDVLTGLYFRRPPVDIEIPEGTFVARVPFSEQFEYGRDVIFTITRVGDE